VRGWGGEVRWDTYGVDGGGEERLVDGVREPGEPDGDGGGEAVDGEGWEEEEGEMGQDEGEKKHGG